MNGPVLRDRAKSTLAETNFFGKRQIFLLTCPFQGGKLTHRGTEPLEPKMVVHNSHDVQEALRGARQVVSLLSFKAIPDSPRPVIVIPEAPVVAKPAPRLMVGFTPTTAPDGLFERAFREPNLAVAHVPTESKSLRTYYAYTFGSEQVVSQRKRADHDALEAQGRVSRVRAHDLADAIRKAGAK